MKLPQKCSALRVAVVWHGGHERRNVARVAQFQTHGGVFWRLAQGRAREIARVLVR